MISVSIKPVALFAISDHVSRKSPFAFGVLIGSQSSDNILIIDAFELKTNKEEIDFEYLEKRSWMALAVGQSGLIVGLYAVNEDKPPESFWDQFALKGVHTPSIYFLAKGGEIECYCYLSREKLDLVVNPGETEEIATETVHTHEQYNSDGQCLNPESPLSLIKSLKNLRDRLVQILNDDNLSAEEELQLVHLANIVCEAPQSTTEEPLLFISARLAILNNELSIIKSLEIVNSRNIASYLIGILKDKPN